MNEIIEQFLSRFLFSQPKRKIFYLILAVFFITASASSYFLNTSAENHFLTFKKDVADIQTKEEILSQNLSEIADGESTPTTTGKSSTSKNKNTNSGSGSSASSSNNSSGSSSSGSTGSSGSDTTPPDESPSAFVSFYADNQTDTAEEQENHIRVANYILGTGANPVFHAGDLMEDGTESSWNYFLSATATLRSTRTFYAAFGNNDRLDNSHPNDPSPFWAFFGFPNDGKWYSVNYGNLHLVILDSAFSSGSSSQYNWLVSDLQSAASQSRITGVMFHHPIYPGDEKGMRSSYAPIFRDMGVDFVVSGHNHSYYHNTVDGVNYFVCTGQPSIGYFLMRVYSNSATLTAYNSSNGVIETVSFSER